VGFTTGWKVVINMTTLLKAYLIGTNDPMELTKIFINELKEDLQEQSQITLKDIFDSNELKKDIQAYSQAKIGEEYDILEWNEDKTDIEEGIDEWEEAVYDIKEDIRGRAKWVSQLDSDIRVETAKMGEERDTNLIRRLRYARNKLQNQNDELDENDRKTIRGHQRHIRSLKKELQYYTRWYKEEVGFSEEEWADKPIEEKVDVLNESLDILNKLIIDAEKEEWVNDPISEAELIEEIEAAKLAFDNASDLISDQEKKKGLDKQIASIRRQAREGAKFEEVTNKRAIQLKMRYLATLNQINTLEELADSKGEELSDDSKGKREERAKSKDLKHSLEREVKESKWAKAIEDSEKLRRKKLPLHHEQKKIWLEGGYPSWAWVSKDMEKPKYVHGLNERLDNRGVERIPINKFITDLYKDSKISLDDFKEAIKKEYPRIMKDATNVAATAATGLGNWSDWEAYNEQLAHVLRKPKEDTHGDSLLLKLNQLMRNLSDEELKVWNKPIAVRGKTEHGLTNPDGSMGSKKVRFANLKSLRDVYHEALSELKLSESQITNIKYILERIDWAVEEDPKTIAEDDDEEDLTEQHTLMIETLHDMYDMALDIREAFPDDKEKTYQWEAVKEALEQIKEMLAKIDSDEKPERDDLMEILRDYYTLSRLDEKLQIPNWGPAKSQIVDAINRLERKMKKFYGKLEDKDLAYFKKLLQEEKLLDSKTEAVLTKPQNLNFSTERKKNLRTHITNSQKIVKRFKKKYGDYGVRHKMLLKQLISAYFPKYKVVKPHLLRKKIDPQAINNQRTQLINDIVNDVKISLKKYYLLYARNVIMDKKEMWVEPKGDKEGYLKDVQDKKHSKTFSDVNYARWKAQADKVLQEGEEEFDEITQQISQDNDKVLDDDEIEDFMDIVGQEADIQIAEEDLREHVKDKLGEKATEYQIEQKIKDEKQKAKLAQERAELEAGETDKALIARMNKLLDDGKEELKEGENFSQFIKRILAKEKREKGKSRTQIKLPDERRIDEERQEAEGIGEEEAQYGEKEEEERRLQELISQPLTYKPRGDSE
jgi:hypothetical protein